MSQEQVGLGDIPPELSPTDRKENGSRRLEVLKVGLRELACLIIGGLAERPERSGEILYRYRVHLLSNTDRGHLVGHVQELLERLGESRYQIAQVLAVLCSSPSVAVASVTSLQRPSGVNLGPDRSRPEAGSGCAPATIPGPQVAGAGQPSARIVSDAPGPARSLPAQPRAVERGDSFRSSTHLRRVEEAPAARGAGNASGSDTLLLSVTGLEGRAGSGATQIQRRISSAVIYREILADTLDRPIQSRGRVLVVEDDSSYRELTSYRIRSKGYQVCATGDGQEALQFLRQTPFNLIVLDMKLPGVHGLEILDFLSRYSQRIPVVLSTGYADMFRLPQVKAYGPLRSCLKPDDGQQIVRLIDELITRVG